MATRPSFSIIQPGVETWLSDMNDALNALFNAPFPLARYATFGAFPNAALYEDCFALDQSSRLIYVSDGVDWNLLISSNVDKAIQHFAFNTHSSGTYYIGGFYNFATTDDDFSPSAVSFGSANLSYGAHIFVVLGAASVDEISITVTGTSITPSGTRTASDTEVITIPNGSSVDDYFETTKSWIGQVTLQTTAGTPKTCNYGFCRHYDAWGRDFSIGAFCATWIGGASDSGVDIKLRHHKTTGWTFNTGAAPTPPAPLHTLQNDHVAEYAVANGVPGSWGKNALAHTILGSGTEGVLFEVISTSPNAFDVGNLCLDVTYL